MNMRKSIIICLSLFFSYFLFTCPVDAQNYKVTANPSLNVRSGPGQNYQSVGSLLKGDQVLVHGFSDDWAQITWQGKTAYINSKYIESYNNVGSPYKSFTDGLSFPRVDGRTLLYILIFTVVFTVIFNWIRPSRTVVYLALAVIGGIEIAFFIILKEDIWFCLPDKVGWGWTIVNFILYGFILAFQFTLFRTIFGELAQTSCYFMNPKPAKWIFVIMIVLCLLAAMGNYVYSILILGIYQLIQMIYIFRLNDGSPVKLILLSILSSLIGIISVIGFLAALFYYIQILIVVVMGIVILKIIDMINNGNSVKSKVEYSDGTSEDLIETGKGITGERYYKGKDSGRTFVD